MRLVKTSAALNLSTVEKGHFPHKFNKQENNNYLTPINITMAETMSDKDKAEFDKWYNDVADGVFDFQKELYNYDRNDVVLLREACVEYRTEFIECTGLLTIPH